MIEVKNIIKSYGYGESRFQMLQGISLEITAFAEGFTNK